MRTIYEARNLIKGNKGKKVIVQVLGIRNKITVVEGVISECYANIFVVNDGINNKSFSYSDVLIGNILVNIK